MTKLGAFVLFASVWFLALFLVLPFGQRSQDDAGEIVPGTPASAPHQLRMGRKLILTTIITVVVWLICYWLIEGGVFTREQVRVWDHMIRRDP